MILVFESGEFQAHVTLDDPSVPVEEFVHALYGTLPRIGDRASLSMFSASGKEVVVLDRERLGAAWLMGLLTSVQEDGANSSGEGTLDENGFVRWYAIPPLLSRNTNGFYLILWWAAIVLGAKNRFVEVRRFVRALQVATVSGWGRELNLGYLDNSSGVLRVRRAIALAIVQLVSQKWKRLLLLIVGVLFYAIWR